MYSRGRGICGNFRRWINIPARIKRVEGECPPILHKATKPRDIVDLDMISDNGSSYVHSNASASRNGRVAHPESKSQSMQSNAQGRRDVSSKSGEDLIKSFDMSRDIEASDLKLKKFRWLPNPFLSEGDKRQGGPLYYAKYFRDRDRRLDSKLVREEISRQSDLIGELGNEDKVQDNAKRERKRAVWRNYRPVTIAQVNGIDSLGKAGRILANEIHLFNEGAFDRSDILKALEKKVGELVLTQRTEDNVDLVKIIYQFGVYQEMDPLVLNRCLDVVISSLRGLKPENLVYLIEALSRLRFRDQRVLLVVDSLALCWPLVYKSSPNLLIRAANALSRLDVTIAGDLAGVLGECLGNLNKKQLEKIKAVSLCNASIFHDVMLLDYFVLCHRADVDYVRHVLLAFIKIRSSKPELVQKLPVGTREWLEAAAGKESLRKETKAIVDTEDNEKFSSFLHRDVSRMLENIGCNFVQRTSCGPVSFDIFIPEAGIVIEACSEFQFYQRTAKFTADARLRHDLIRSMGFKLIPVIHFHWNSLKDGEAKAAWIRQQLGT